MRLLKCLFKKKSTSLEMKKFLIVGLGNIGEEYQNTRHNVGFQILDRLATKNELLWTEKKTCQLRPSQTQREAICFD